MENENKNENLILNCEICLTNYDLTEKIPILLPCQHSICIKCLDQLKPPDANTKLTCPYCRSDLNKDRTCKNLSIIWKIKNNDDSCNQKWRNLLCPNNHFTEFTKKHNVGRWGYYTKSYCGYCQDLYKCHAPHLNGHHLEGNTWVPKNIDLDQLFSKCIFETENCVKTGYGCKECSFLICVRCSNPILPIDKCLYGHELIWTNNQRGECINEHIKEVKKHGFVCKEGCLYYLCSDCRIMKINSKFCFNDHILTWIRKGSNCVKCDKSGSPGFNCKEDGFFACDKCLKTDYLKFE